ncbi:MAG: tyrosine-type recombinase/integrase [Candidatus Wallbacteria bacterium]
MARGYIEKRGDTWRLVYPGGTGPDGKRVKHTKKIKVVNKREAEKELIKFGTEVESGMVMSVKPLTLKEFAERWIAEYAERQLAPKTLADYKQQLKDRIIPKLGNLKLDQITPLHLMKYYNYLRSENIRLDGKSGKLSEKTVQKNHMLISSILQKAVNWQMLASNPSRRVEKPKPVKKRVICYNEAQTKILFEKIKDEPLKYQLAIFIAVLCGIRLGELLGLEWKDINFERKTLMIQRASQYVNNIGIITKMPKNESSIRKISISLLLTDMFQKYKEAQADEIAKVGSLWNATDRLFTQWNGKPMHPSAITHWFERFLKRNELPVINFHALRHTSATLLIAKGVHPKTISSRLGHANISTTMDIYGHALEATDKVAAEKLDEIITED